MDFLKQVDGENLREYAKCIVRDEAPRHSNSPRNKKLGTESTSPLSKRHCDHDQVIKKIAKRRMGARQISDWRQHDMLATHSHSLHQTLSLNQTASQELDSLNENSQFSHFGVQLKTSRFPEKIGRTR